MVDDLSVLVGDVQHVGGRQSGTRWSRKRAALAGQWVTGEDPFLHRPAALEVLLDELWDALGGHAVLPGALRVDHHRGRVAAVAQAAGVVRVARVGPRPEAVTLDGQRESLPRRHPHLGRAATRPGTEKDGALVAANPDLGRGLLQLLPLVAHEETP